MKTRLRSQRSLLFGLSLKFPRPLCAIGIPSVSRFWRVCKVPRLSALRSDYPLYFMLVRWLCFGPCMAFHTTRTSALGNYPPLGSRTGYPDLSPFRNRPCLLILIATVVKDATQRRFAPAGLLVVVVRECNRDLNRFALDVVPRPSCFRCCISASKMRCFAESICRGNSTKGSVGLSQWLRRGSCGMTRP